MQQEPFAETLIEPDESLRFDRGQYTMLLHEQLSEVDGEVIYFSLPDQEHYLYEYEGDLEEVLDDLPEIYEAIAPSQQSENLTLTPQATAMVERLWNYFEQTGERELEGEHNFNFRVEADCLLVISKDDVDQWVAISQDGRVESTLELTRYEHLMEQFTVAYDQMQIASQQETEQGWELG
ncbi:hypothetical protein H6F88_32170 [Oculatella sp. FACHB-28]|uniref:hypothetical protein n=1 Tax=Oculatella sp. FACHB-28 TaxID=2692845 RepID=UPI001687EE41|nr:hypothetical protein [Oculatella sp. FACHB-28]MBD2060602.1 hypothetical protein [Oculatella sp. FACHB-28]